MSARTERFLGGVFVDVLLVVLVLWQGGPSWAAAGFGFLGFVVVAWSR